MGKKPLNIKATSVFFAKPSQYKSDLEKALDYLLEQSYPEVLLTGIGGKRFDHALTNISILAKYSDRIKISFFDTEGYGIVTNSKLEKTIKFDTKKETVISLLAAPFAGGITTEGLYYPLDNENLEFGNNKCEGISNVANQKKIKISFTEGCLITFINNAS